MRRCFPRGDVCSARGRAAIARLVDGLYDCVEADAVLRPAFSRDLTHQRALATLFFEAWCGGAPTYFDAAWREGPQVQHRAIAISRGMAQTWPHATRAARRCTALHCAGFVHVIAVLLEHGADVNALNEREQTPLDNVETAGRSSVRDPVRRLLIAHGARRGSAPQEPPTGGAAVRW